MSTRVMTLFGEEIIPEPQKPAVKARGKKGEETLAEPTEGQVTEAAPQVVQEEITEVVAEMPAVIEVAVEPIPEEDVILALVSEIPAAEVTEPISLPETELEAEVVPVTEIVTEQRESVVTLNDADELPVYEEAEEEMTDIVAPAAVEEIIPEDWHGDKKYYTIGEVAGFFKVKTSHIRFWTNEFKLKVRTTRKGDRLFSPEQVKELRAIYHLVKERGFTLSGAKTKLKAQNKRDVTTVDLKTSLLQLKSRLVILRDQLV